MKKLGYVGTVILASTVMITSCITDQSRTVITGLGFHSSRNSESMPETPNEDVVVSTLAGEGRAGLRNGPGIEARFHHPAGITVDTSGNVYVADIQNRAIRQIEPNGEASIRSIIPRPQGMDTTAMFGGSLTTTIFFPAKGTSMLVFVHPLDVIMGVDGNFYLVAYGDHRIWKVIPGGKVEVPEYEFTLRDQLHNIGGEIELLAGSYPYKKGNKDGKLSEAKFDNPQGLATDIAGNIYVADTGNHSIRKITTEGEVITLAGGVKKGFMDGSGAEARFNNPIGIAVDASGNIYVSDIGNHSIRKVTADGVVSTLAGNGEKGFMDGSTTKAQFNTPRGVAVDLASGNIYVADQKNNLIRKITPEGMVSTYAGSGIAGFKDGNGVTARFKNPFDVAVDLEGNVFVTDISNHRIRMLEEVSDIPRDIVHANDTDGQNVRM